MVEPSTKSILHGQFRIGSHTLDEVYDTQPSLTMSIRIYCTLQFGYSIRGGVFLYASCARLVLGQPGLLNAFMMS